MNITFDRFLKKVDKTSEDTLHSTLLKDNWHYN